MILKQYLLLYVYKINISKEIMTFLVCRIYNSTSTKVLLNAKSFKEIAMSAAQWDYIEAEIWIHWNKITSLSLTSSPHDH